MKSSFTNPEIVTLAIYLISGESSQVDIEDVAMKASEISPGRFSWRKYPGQINIFQVASALSDARKPSKLGYVMGSMQGGWMLTDKGLKFAQRRIKHLQTTDQSRKPQTAKERHWENNERIRLLSEPAFAKFQSGHQTKISQTEVESFFRINDYVVGHAREKKIVRILNVFGTDAELGTAVRKLAARVRG